jgi:tungstate transport system ATP-binding protein
MNSGLAYSIRSLVHSYDGKIALDIPRLDIPSGVICAFTGPNGSGKTTLLSILALLIAPVSGSVLLDGIESVQNRDPQLRHKVTLVHQKPFLFSTKVRNNIAYGLRAHGHPPKEIKRRVRAIVEEMGLSAVADKQALKISGGEAQRAVLARALVLETPILLLDEPTNSLDDASRPTFAQLLRRAHQARGSTILIAAHDIGFVSSLTDRIFRMEGGRLQSSRELHGSV